jgi:DNA-binding transcriptional MerR regulator
MTDHLMTIREMCDTFDVTPRTLRFYESKELISPLRDGTKRLFDKRDRARLKLILRGKRFGFSLEDMRQLLDLYDAENKNISQVDRAIEIGKIRLAEMERQRSQLDVAIKGLREQLSWGEQHLETLINETAKAAE